MRHFVFILCIICSGLESLAQIQDANALQLAIHRTQHAGYRGAEQDSLCISGLNAARASLDSGNVTYYVIGKASVIGSKRMHYIANRFSFTLDHAYCTAESDAFCYNQIVDSFLNSKYNCKFWRMANKLCDSLQEVGLLDREVIYNGGEEQLQKDFAAVLKKQGIELDSFVLSYDLKHDPFTGTKTLAYFYCEPEKFKPLFQKILVELDGYKPAISNGKVAEGIGRFQTTYPTSATHEW
ncbi:MAG: hypothetical protein RL660_1397 [Bacteroidota bacterium]